MNVPFAHEIMPLITDSEGVVRIGETRVTLSTLVAAFRDGATAEEIVQRYPCLNLADVYQVIGYYLKHPLEIEDCLSRHAARASAVRRENEARFDPEGVRDRLLARRSNRAS